MHSCRDKSDAVNNIAGRHYQHATIRRHHHRIIKLETFIFILFPTLNLALFLFALSLIYFVTNCCFSSFISFIEWDFSIYCGWNKSRHSEWMAMRNSDGNKQFSLTDSSYVCWRPLQNLYWHAFHSRIYDFIYAFNGIGVSIKARSALEISSKLSVGFLFHLRYLHFIHLNLVAGVKWLLAIAYAQYFGCSRRLFK